MMIKNIINVNNYFVINVDGGVSDSSLIQMVAANTGANFCVVRLMLCAHLRKVNSRIYKCQVKVAVSKKQVYYTKTGTNFFSTVHSPMSR